jgi:hypothetical protein
MFIDNTFTTIVTNCLFAMFIDNTLTNIVNNYVYWQHVKQHCK